MRSSRITLFVLPILLCGALVASGMSEGRLGMAGDLDSPAVAAPDQIETEAPSRQSADLSDEIDQFGDCADDYYYCYGYEYVAQTESSQDAIDTVDSVDDTDDSYYGDYETDDNLFGMDDGIAAEESQEAIDQPEDGFGDYEQYTYEYDDEYSYDDDYSYDDSIDETAENVIADESEEVREDDFSYEYDEEYSYDDYMSDEYDYSIDETPESDIADEIEEVQEDGFSYEHDEEYSYDNYMSDEYDYSTNDTAENDIEDEIEEIQEDGSSYEYDEEYSYNDHMSDEYDYSIDETAESDVADEIEEVQEDSFSYEYDSYDYQYGHRYTDELETGYEFQDEYMEEGVEEAEAEETATPDGYEDWEDEYDSGYETEAYDYTTEYDEYGEYAPQPETEADETEADSGLEEHSWESEYDEYEEYMYQPEVEEADAVEVENDTEFEEYGSWESEYDESAEWDSEYDESEYDESAEWESEYDYSDYVDDAMETDTPAEDDLGVYSGYSDAYPDEEYAYPEYAAGDIAQDESQSDCEADEFGDDGCDDQVEPSEDLAQDDYWDEYGYEYSYPETKYGSDRVTREGSDFESRLEGEPGEPASAMEEYPKEDVPSGVELFAWHPYELLFYQDQEILKTLERLCEDPSGVRRATLNDYLEDLGSDAIEFAARFEDFSSVDVLGLADDLPGTAAFLASFRLLQRGELGMDEAVDVLRHSLDNLSLDWIEGVERITADAFDDWDAGMDQPEDESADWDEMTSTARPLVVAMLSIANRSIGGAKDAVTSFSSQLGEMELSTVLRELSADR